MKIYKIVFSRFIEQDKILNVVILYDVKFDKYYDKYVCKAFYIQNINNNYKMFIVNSDIHEYVSGYGYKSLEDSNHKDKHDIIRFIMSFN